MPRSRNEKSPATMLSRSAPTSPKNLHDLNKSSTLPQPRLAGGTLASTSTSGGSSGANGARNICGGNVGASPRKSRSATLSNFLRKLSPKLRQGTSKGRDKTWYVVEIAQRDVDGQGGEHADEELDVRGREQMLPPLTDTGTSTSREHLEPRPGANSVKGTPSKLSSRILGNEKQTLLKVAPKTYAQEAVSRSQNPRQSDPPTSKAIAKGHATEQVQPVPATFASQPVIRINSGAESSSQGEITPTGPRVRRLHQPPRTLNILNKIVVHPPEVEKVKGKMASVESIGSCSLDVDGTASESSGTTDGRTSSISQRTLYSASVDLGSGNSSLHGPADRSPNKTCIPVAPQHATTATSASEVRYISELYIPNGQIHSAPDGRDDSNEQRKPSYINLSCSVSGYTSYSCYNSKVREGLRSRDNSPARLAFAAGSSCNDDLHTLDIEVTEDGEIKARQAPTRLHTSSITLNVGNGTDVADRASRLSLYEEKRSSMWRASSEDGILDRNGSPAATVTLKRHETHEHYSAATLRSAHYESGEIIDRNGEDEGSFNGHGKESKSLIQQRIERLYGPGALAQGFRFHRERKVSESESSGPAAAKPTSKHLYHLFNEQQTNSANATPTSKLIVTNGSGVRRSRADLMVNGKDRTNGDIAQDQRANTIPEPSFENESLVSCNSQNHQACTKNGKWFIEIMNKEKDKIKCLIAKAEQILTNETLSEDACGKIRAAIGKANLLLTQKFQQFKGLCEKNVTQSAGEQFPTTVEDLAGFWDMVLIQVADIRGMFAAIDRAHQNGWIADEMVPVSFKKDHKSTTVPDGSGASLPPVSNAKPKRSVLRKTVSSAPQRSTKAEEASRAREEARRRLLEAKRKGRQQAACLGDDSKIEIYVPDEKD